MSGGHHPRSFAWAFRKLHVAKLRLAWSIAEALGLSDSFGISPRKGAAHG
ncbi:MAG: hypothetical protein KJ667_10440 [Alphaproteobacteria bacterium]|nr:hypothetical protein [Alphaproteobacteria bacterium]